MNRPRLRSDADVYAALESYVARHGMPPTVQELRGVLGVGSTRTVHRYLKALEARGWIRRWPGARGLALLGQGEGT